MRQALRRGRSRSRGGGLARLPGLPQGNGLLRSHGAQGPWPGLGSGAVLWRLLGGGSWASSLLLSPQENNPRQDFQRPSDSLRGRRLVSSEALTRAQKDKSKVISSHPSPLLPSRSSSAGPRGLAGAGLKKTVTGDLGCGRPGPPGNIGPAHTATDLPCQGVRPGKSYSLTPSQAPCDLGACKEGGVSTPHSEADRLWVLGFSAFSAPVDLVGPGDSQWTRGRKELRRRQSSYQRPNPSTASSPTRSMPGASTPASASASARNWTSRPTSFASARAPHKGRQAGCLSPKHSSRGSSGGRGKGGPGWRTGRTHGSGTAAQPLGPGHRPELVPAPSLPYARGAQRGRAQGAAQTLSPRLGNRAEGGVLRTLLQLHEDRAERDERGRRTENDRHTDRGGGGACGPATDSGTHPTPSGLRRGNGHTPRRLGPGQERNACEPLSGSVPFPHLYQGSRGQ